MEDYNSQNAAPVLYSMWIQLGFALAFIAIALVVTLQERGKGKQTRSN